MGSVRELPLRQLGKDRLDNIEIIKYNIIMKLDKASKRDKARNKRKNGMVISNRSIFNIVRSQLKRIKKDKK